MNAHWLLAVYRCSLRSLLMPAARHIVFTRLYPSPRNKCDVWSHHCQHLSLSVFCFSHLGGCMTVFSVPGWLNSFTIKCWETVHSSSGDGGVLVEPKILETDAFLMLGDRSRPCAHCLCLLQILGLTRCKESRRAFIKLAVYRNWVFEAGNSLAHA